MANKYVFGHHAVVCDCSGDRIKRHNAIRDCLFDSCVAACWAPVKETPFLLAGSSERPADIFIPNFSHGKGLVIDTAVTCPLQRTSLHDSSRVAGFSGFHATSMQMKLNQSLLELELRVKALITFHLLLSLLVGFLKVLSPF